MAFLRPFWPPKPPLRRACKGGRTMTRKNIVYVNEEAIARSSACAEVTPGGVAFVYASGRARGALKKANKCLAL